MKTGHIAFVFIITSFASAAKADLLHHFPFDETSGTIARDIVGSLEGVIGSGVTLAQPGRLGTAFGFPAVAADAASRVTLPAQVVPGAEFTMSASVFLPVALANGGQGHIISGNNGAVGRWNLGISDVDTTTGVDARLFWFHNGGVGAVNFAGYNFNNHLNEWIHVGITRTAEGATTLYINGVPAEVGSSTTSLVSTPVGIGERPNAAQFQFAGRIDDVRFHNTPLTAAEMTELSKLNSDMDNDGLPDEWEQQYFQSLAFNGDADPDGDGFSNRIEFLAGTNPSDNKSFPTGDNDGDGMDDGWEWLNFGSPSRDGFADFDSDGSLDIEEFTAARGLLFTRNPNGSIATVDPFTGSSKPNNPNSQPDADDDGLPDGFEYLYFKGIDQTSLGDFDSDGFSNKDEFLAGSNPARSANTPLNVHVTTRVAVTHQTGIDEYSVSSGMWTFVRRIATTSAAVFAVTGHPDGYLYASTTEQSPRILRIHPATGEVSTLATRGEGQAAAAGWNLSDPQGIEVGPDGKLYFSTAFGTPAGEGVFRIKTDGSGLERFIAKAGDGEAGSWSLNNARDLHWWKNTLFVSARGGFNAINRPVYQFSADGAFLATVASNLVGPQGLTIDETGLLVTSTATGLAGLYQMSAEPPFPATPSQIGTQGAVGGMDIIDLNGDLYYVTFNTGAAGVGQVIRKLPNGSVTAVVPALPGTGNDLAIFTSNLVADPYGAWASGFGIDPAAPNGGRTADFDGDGTSNEVEFALGLTPTDGSSRFAVTRSGTPAAGITLTWPSAAGIAFQVRSSPDLQDWSTLEATVIGQPGQATAAFTTSPSPAGTRFYRIQFTP
jgi:hypothetical protein